MEFPKRTLLLVDDEMLIAMAETKALTEEGCSIDLILMDIDLGRGMDGMEAAREIRERETVDDGESALRR